MGQGNSRDLWNWHIAAYDIDEMILDEVIFCNSSKQFVKKHYI